QGGPLPRLGERPRKGPARLPRAEDDRVVLGRHVTPPVLREWAPPFYAAREVGAIRPGPSLLQSPGRLRRQHDREQTWKNESTAPVGASPGCPTARSAGACGPRGQAPWGWS